MAGGLIHLAYIGNQEKYLTQMPEITFFKTMYCRYGHFAIEDHYIQSSTDVQLGKGTYFKIRDYGDLVFRPYMKITLPTIEAQYIYPLDYYTDKYYAIKHVNNINVNNVLTKIGAMIHNRDHINIPVVLNNNTIISYNRENLINGVVNYDYKSNGFLPDISMNTSFDHAHDYTLTFDFNNNRDIYYASYNIKYLTDVLSKTSFDDQVIITNDDYFELFKSTLFDYIVRINENKFIHSLLNNQQLLTENLSSKNVVVNYTNELTFSLQYLFSNMKLLYVYNPSKQLKSIFTVEDYSYSGDNYTNKVRVVENLYPYLNSIISDVSSTLFISDGYSLNKNVNIHTIENITIEGDYYYDISSNIEKDNNKLYMVYIDTHPQDQNINKDNTEEANIEDYYDMYFNGPNKNTYYNIYPDVTFKLPLCYLKYNSDVGYYEKIAFSSEVTKDDFVFLYKDVVIFDEESQHYSFVLINNKMYELTQMDTGVQYTNSLYIRNGVDIIDKTIEYNGNTTFLLNSDNGSLTFINNYTNQKYHAQNYIVPYVINITLNDKFRLIPISMVTNLNLDLDTFSNLNYVRSEIDELNISNQEKISIIYDNVTNCIDYNMKYISELFKNIFNNDTYYKFYNMFSYINKNVTISLAPQYLTNIANNIIGTDKVNGVNSFYNVCQSLIIKNIDNFITSTETLFSGTVRYIMDSDYKTSFINMLNNVYNNDMYLYIEPVNTYPYFETVSDITLSDIYFEINSDYEGYDILTDLSNNIGLVLEKDATYYSVKNMFADQRTLTSGTDTLRLTPYTNTANKEFYVLNTLLNTVSDSSGNYIIDTLYILPHGTDISDVTPSTYAITINRTPGALNVLTIYDNIVNNNSSYFFDKLIDDTNNTKNSIIDIHYVLYHYATLLFRDVRSRTQSIYQTNNFTKYNDSKMFEMLRHIKQSIYKKSRNGNSKLSNIANLTTASTYYIDCNLCFQDHIDSEIIANTLQQTFTMYSTQYVRPLIVALLQNKVNYFNFYKESYDLTFIDVSNNDSLDINLNLINNFKLLQWYYHFLNSIKSDINDYIINDSGIELITGITVKQINDLVLFFDTSTNIFNPSYLGTTFTLTLSDYSLITTINNHMKDVMNHIKIIVKDRTMQLPNGTTVIYSDNTSVQIYETILFDDMSMFDLVTVSTTIYTHNFDQSYVYKDILPLFTEFKTKYLNFYYNILSDITGMSSFSSTYMNRFKQILNFDLTDYENQMSWIKVNPLFNDDDDIFKYKTNTSSLITDETYHKYRLINDSTVCDIFYTSTSNIYKTYSNIFYNNRYLLSIMYVTIQEMITKFNQYFNFDYTFYSDYRIIYVIYFYYYLQYTFMRGDTTYTLTFDVDSNTSNKNKIVDLSSGDEYLYSYVVFSIGNDIRYTIVNNKFYDLSENTFINYTHNYVYDNSTINEVIKKYDNVYTYSIINNYIVDLSEDIKYVIKHSSIHDLSDNVVGSFANDEYIIDNVVYKYEVTDLRVRALYPNLTTISIVNSHVTIMDVDYEIKQNVFHDSSRQIAFEFVIPNTNIDNEDPMFKVIYNDENITLTPSVLNSYSSTHSATLDILPVFSTVFTKNEMKKSIRYLQESVQNQIFNTDKTIKTNNVSSLLSLILSNSLITSDNITSEMLMCASFNNRKDDMDEIISYIDTLDIANNVKIFNETDQTIESYNSNVEGKDFNFVMERSSYFPLPVYDSTTDLQNHFKSNIEIMLDQALIAKELNLYDDISKNNHNTNLVKDYIINKVIDDVSENVVSDFYDSNVVFDISYDIVTHGTTITPDTHFIRNSVLINYDEYQNMYCIQDTSHTLIYDNMEYYISDINNNKYKITMMKNINEDISYNNCYLKFENDVVFIDISTSSWPKTLNIMQGKLYRNGYTDYGYELDSSYNLKHTFKYDISMDMLIKTTHVIDDDISCTMIETFNDLSENYLGSYVDTWNYNVVNDVSNYYCYIDISKNMDKRYIIVDDGTETFLGFITYSLFNDISQQLVKIYFFDNFVYDNSKTYTIKVNRKSFLSKLSTNKLWYKPAFYYWETFSSSLNIIDKIMDKYDDKYFLDQKFTHNTYPEKIFSKLNDNTKLFENHIEIFDRLMLYNSNKFNTSELVNASYNTVFASHKKFKSSVAVLLQTLNRDTIPKCSWIDYIGDYICDNVVFKINGEVVEDINDQIIHNHNIRHTNDNTISMLNRMTGHNSELQMPQNIIKKKTIYVPLPLCFDHHTKALPMIALINSDLTIDANFKSLNELVKFYPDIKIKVKGRMNVELGLSYVYLDTEVREKFARSRHEYLYDIKRYMKFTIDKNIDELKLELSNPCKEMSWLYMDQKIKDMKDYWNYTGKPYTMYNTEFIYNNVYQDDDVKALIDRLIKNKEKRYNRKLTITSLNNHEINQVITYIKNRPYNPNPFNLTTLDYSGHNRFSMTGAQTNLIEPLLYYNDSIAPGLNVRTWSRTPNEILHMGYNNFTLNHDMRLGYELNLDNVDGEIVFMWTEYNLLRIASGIGCKMW